jgi:hypothetical protein
MSITYLPLTKIPSRQLFDGRLRKAGIRERRRRKTTETFRCLATTNESVWVQIDDEGFVRYLRAFDKYSGMYIRFTIARAFDTYLAAEYEPEFWGFNTRKEWVESRFSSASFE